MVKERARIASGCGGEGGNAGVSHVQTARAPPSTATLPKAQPVPTTEAMPPSTGPKSAPPIAAAIAEPISSPRRAGGDAATSHASPAVQVNELDTPWRKRAATSGTYASSTPKANVVTIIPTSPMRTVGFTPRRAAENPPGSAPKNAPAA